MTTTYETLLYEAADGVATVTLNRPNVHNAMNEALRRDMMRCFETLATDETVRVIVVTGAGGRAFSAGADIREFTAPQVPTVFRENRRRLDFRAAMEKCWQPIIAAIGGHCFGGGLELALACDIRIAAADSFTAESCRGGSHASLERVSDRRSLVGIKGTRVPHSL